jgi:SWI/SNF-related matrix-associated actin-dependent regulator 1 of chromatin subfamily A
MPQLYEHQTSGAEWLAEHARRLGGGYLADDMGLGKTRTLLHAISLLNAKRPVVICPAIVRTHWTREAELLGVPLQHVMSYEGAVNGGTALQKSLNADLVISDEAHYCKSMEALRTRRVFGVSGYVRQAKYFLAASGTPMPKNPLELWPILAVFPAVCQEHGLLNRRVFIDRFCFVKLIHMRGRRIEKVLPVLRNEAEFHELVAKVMLRRTANDVGLDVPTLDYPLLSLDLSGLPDAPLSYSGDPSAPGVETVEWRHRVGDAKAPIIAAMLADQLRDSSDKVVVFAHHRSVLAVLRTALREFGIAYIDGDTPAGHRPLLIDEFQNNPTVRVFLGQNQACMTGITLTAAHRAVLVEPDWTAQNNRQLGRRIARIGQKVGHCQAHLVVAAGTLDEGIMRLNQAEIRMAEKAGFADAA